MSVCVSLDFGCHPYPKYFITPSGRRVPVKDMTRILKIIRANRDAMYPGWDEWKEIPVPGHEILKASMQSLHKRINIRAGVER
jgi:hypothetical protein